MICENGALMSMSNEVVRRGLIVAAAGCLAMQGWNATASAAAASTLESSTLRLEITDAPYSYAIVEKRSGVVLLRQSQTTIDAGGARSASTATIGSKTATAIEATLAFGDPSDAARIRWTFVNPNVVRVQLSHEKAASITEAFVDQGERSYGLWEYSYYGAGGALDNRGANNQPLLGLSGPPVGSGDPSGRAPFYLTSRKYGVYADTLASGRATIGVSGRTSVTFETPALTYYVIYGQAPADILRQYNQLAGGSLMPPLWAFDPIWWRDDHHADFAANGVTNAQALVKKDADNLQRLRLPGSAIWLDRPYGSGGGGLGGWGNFDFDPGPTGFPNPDEMVADLRQRNMYLIGWIANRANNTMVTDPLFAKGIFNSANGFTGNFTTTPALDLRRPEVYAHFKNRLRDGYVKRGMRGFKIDRGEQGEMPASLQNELAVLTAKAAYDATSDVLGPEGFTFARNVYDRARKYVAVWNGDSNATLEGMSDSLKQLLRLGPIMYSMVGSDTGGYGRSPNAETFARWLALSAYSPMMEILIGPNRTPWYSYDSGPNANAQIVAITRTFTQEHHDLIPYIRSLVYTSTQTGMPAMRMMPLVFPDDRAVADMFDEYMFGDALLVAPVLTAGATSRSVSLPSGEWIDGNDRKTRHTGPATITASAPLDVIPRFVRAGSIVPRGDILQSNNNWTANWTPSLRIEFYPALRTASRFDYYTGTRAVPMTGSMSSTMVTWESGDLGVNVSGVLEVHGIDRYTSVRRNNQTLGRDDFQHDAAAQVLTIPLRGATSIQIGVRATGK
jgi:alpha-glucosidase (family GH31 glycosyl hydrolase)